MAETRPNTKSSIQNLKSVISKRGLSRSTLFEVDLAAMAGKLGFDQNEIRDLEILVTKATIPTRTLATFEYGLFRNDTSFVSGYTNSDFTVDFILTEDYLAKRVFNKWLNLIVTKDQYVVNYKDTYVCDIGVKQLKKDKNNTVIYEATLEKCFPKGVSEITVNSSSEGGASAPGIAVSFLYNDIKFPEDS